MIKELLRKFVPAGVRSKIYTYREAAKLKALFDGWQAGKSARGNVASRQTAATGSIIVVPTDPWTLTGARGDDAMIQSAIHKAQQAFGDLQVYIITATETADRAASENGMKPLRIWQATDYHRVLADELKRLSPSAVVVLGGDVLDGYYDAFGAAKLIVSADVAASLAIPTTILGFSFNKSPAMSLQKFWDAIDPRADINVRDRISLERFRKFTKSACGLVADSAFVLPRTDDDAEVVKLRTWVEAQRAAGQTVLGINFHPMLFPNKQIDYDAIGDMVAKVMEKTAGSYKISWCILPHDYRGANGDDVCLRPIQSALRRINFNDFYYVEGQHSASVLKSMAGCLDGVIAGRMHLAIAALGCGVPVLALTYQDKFEGLYAHFDLPKKLLLPPQQLLDAAGLQVAFDDFAGSISALTAQVAEKLPSVKEASALNYKVFK